MKVKCCKGCGSSTRKLSYPGPRCLECWRTERKRRLEAQHGARVEATYGLTGEQYWVLYEAQGGCCYLCRRATGKSKRLAVDHDHKTGIVRGLLCKTCNYNIIGYARDNVDYFARCIEYLNDPPAVRLFGEITANE